MDESVECLDALMRVSTAHAAQIMRLECHLQAALAMLCVIGGNAGHDARQVRASVLKHADELLQGRLESVEDRSPALAAELDLRPLWPEDLGSTGEL